MGNGRGHFSIQVFRYAPTQDSRIYQTVRAGPAEGKQSVIVEHGWHALWKTKTTDLFEFHPEPDIRISQCLRVRGTGARPHFYWQARYSKRHAEWERARLWRRKAEVVRRLGGKCARCETTDLRILTINHLHNGAPRNRPWSKPVRRAAHPTGTRVWEDILRGRISIEGLEIRCYNCNILYEYETGRLRGP